MAFFMRSGAHLRLCKLRSRALKTPFSLYVSEIISGSRRVIAEDVRRFKHYPYITKLNIAMCELQRCQCGHKGGVGTQNARAKRYGENGGVGMQLRAFLH